MPTGRSTACHQPQIEVTDGDVEKPEESVSMEPSSASPVSGVLFNLSALFSAAFPTWHDLWYTVEPEESTLSSPPAESVYTPQVRFCQLVFSLKMLYRVL